MTKTKSKLREVYESKPFHQRKRFDDGGSAYSSYPSYTPTAPSAQEIAALTGAGSDTGSGGYGVDANTPQVIDDPTMPTVNAGSTGSSGSGGSGTAGSATAGALGKLLGLSSNSTGMNALQTLIGLGSIAANYSNNKTNTPTFNPPALFGGQSGTSGANGSSGGYGPPGGYNYKNYQGINSSTPGLGYAPRTQINPNIPNYYTYGQQPQASFFSGAASNPSAAPMSSTGGNPSGPTTMKRGGLMRKYASGGKARMFIGGTPAPVSAPNATGAPPAMSNIMPMPQNIGTGYTPQPVNMPQQLGGSGVGALSPPSAPQAPWQPTQPTAMNLSSILGHGTAGSIPQTVNPPIQPMSPNRQIPTTHQPPHPANPAPQVPNPMQQQRPRLQLPHHMASGGSTVDAPGNSPNATSHVIQESGLSPLSAAYQSRRQWQGPSSQNIGMPQGHASGGAEHGNGPLSTVSRHVVGPGDGTSDDIPARLANGEYVVDSQTVSMIGNGSNDAGAKKLDQFRANLRKHKGKALAKGEMAPDAHKNLNKYMGGK